MITGVMTGWHERLTSFLMELTSRTKIGRRSPKGRRFESCRGHQRPRGRVVKAVSLIPSSNRFSLFPMSPHLTRDSIIYTSCVQVHVKYIFAHFHH